MPEVSCEAIVREFLNAMENRDLEKAKSYLSSDFTMEFPGGEKMHTLDELIAWAKPRYQSVRKHYENFDASDAGNSQTVVYCFGTLEGKWLDGTSFAGIRFIDRFSVTDGKITDQKVWNDIAEVKNPLNH